MKNQGEKIYVFSINEIGNFFYQHIDVTIYLFQALNLGGIFFLNGQIFVSLNMMGKFTDFISIFSTQTKEIIMKQFSEKKLGRL